MGTIFSYDDVKGFGFIKLDDGRHLFFHVTDCYCHREQIQVGSEVVFAIKEYRRKNNRLMQKAINVQVV